MEQYLEYAKVNNRYKTYLSKVTSTNSLISFFKGKVLSEIHPFFIDRYKKERLKVVKPASVNRELTCLKHMFSMAKTWKITKENPAKEVKLLKEEKRDVKVLTREKEKEMFDVLNVCCGSRHVREIVLTSLNTGMRQREIFVKRDVGTKTT